MVPVETVERWFLLKKSSDCSCLTINQIIAANIKLDMPVLSLAGCYVQKNKQVRWVDQTQYPMIVVASLSAVPQSCRTPLHEIIQSEGEKPKGRRQIEVLHLFRWFTHTHPTAVG